MVFRWVGRKRLAKGEEAQGEAQEKVTISYASSYVEKPFFDPCRGTPLGAPEGAPKGASRRP